MTQGKLVELSAAQKTDVRCRRKAGQSLHTIGAASASHIRPFTGCCHITGCYYSKRLSERDIRSASWRPNLEIPVTTRPISTSRRRNNACFGDCNRI
jgi:hypothetical protein